MRLRHPLLIKSAGLGAACALRLWLGTLRWKYQALGPDTDPHRADLPDRHIYAMWHEYLLLPVYYYARPDIHVLIGQHTDGELIAQVCHHLGVPSIRGSTTRGGIEAVRGLLRAGRRTHLALTPDGPVGPRRQVQAGVIYLAAQTGMSVVPVGFGLQRPWRARSWDRFALPRPGSRAAIVTGTPVVVQPDADKEERERCRLRLEEALHEVTVAAERWAEEGGNSPRGVK